jgi:hypothetical protein
LGGCEVDGWLIGAVAVSGAGWVDGPALFAAIAFLAASLAA